jgi:Tol biopolymer transport system component/DNA-binding winged helix-turn-helix (wHTH) protein
MNQGPKNTFSFADYEIDVDNRRLTRDGESIVLKAKTFDVLAFFVENAGRVLSKEEILDSVWPDQFVEEANLVVQISALRRALGDKHNDPHFLLTVPGKGYKFVADVETNEEIVVEEHRISRISVEQTEISEKSDEKRQNIRPLLKAFLGAAGLIVLGLLTLAVYREVNSSNHQITPAVNATERKYRTRLFVSSGGGIPSRAAISPDGKALAYVESLKGRNTLRLANIENSNSVEIIPYSDRVYSNLAFAPDAKNIYFTAIDSNHRELALMRVSVYGGAVQDLVSVVDSTVTFSPDGKYVAFLRRDADGMRTSVIVADADTGKNERVLTVREYPENTVSRGIAWSPDGQLIAFAAVDAETGGTALLGVNPADGSITKIGKTVGNRIVNIVWKPDGSGLFVNRNTSNDAGDGKIWLVPYPQGEPQQITDDSLNYQISTLGVSADDRLVAVQARADAQISIALGGNPEKSQRILEGTRSRAEGRSGLLLAPDGKIIFTAKAGDARTIWEMDADANNQRQLTAVQKNSKDQQVSVTPDDRYLIFDSDRSGVSEIWRANRDGTNLEALTNGGGNTQPALSPDGAWIVYVAERNGQKQLWRVSIDGGTPVQITTEQSMWPAVSPDGRYIAYAYGKYDSNPNPLLKIIPFEGGPPIKTFEVPIGAAIYNRLRWTPDGKAIVYKDELLGLWRQNLNSDKPERIPLPGDLRVYHFTYSPDGTMIYAAALPIGEIVILEGSQ